jgi:hypothetical protein
MRKLPVLFFLYVLFVCNSRSEEKVAKLNRKLYVAHSALHVTLKRTTLKARCTLRHRLKQRLLRQLLLPENLPIVAAFPFPRNRIIYYTMDYIFIQTLLASVCRSSSTYAFTLCNAFTGKFVAKVKERHVVQTEYLVSKR